ncbi:polysaccharide deacetylase family protein [Paenibacillus sp. IITD108]|uniref:polysaccharide deacetylase family protein n=1 Tax=Paenibacillus sp. IITD108 TaxID=3116649 RepID=UPI002F421083
MRYIRILTIYFSIVAICANIALGHFSFNTLVSAESKPFTVNKLTPIEINRFKPKTLLYFRALQLASQDSRAAVALLVSGQLSFAFRAAQAAGLKIAEPMELLERSGVQVIRPAYGELDIVLVLNQLSPKLHSFASIALRTYSQIEEYEQDIRLLRSGRFDYKAMLQTDRKHSAAEYSPEAEQLQQLYTHYLLPDNRLLLDKDEQQTFSYLLVFYDAADKPIGYMKDVLPLIQEKLVANPTIAALMYHHFSLNSESLNTVTVHPDTFHEQLKALKENGYTPIRQQDLLEFMKSDTGARLPEKSVLITIDDGYESNYAFAFPAIVEEQFYATIFAVTANLNKKTKYSSRITWPQAREMVQSGRILMQSHTYESHHYGKTAGDKEAAVATVPIMVEGQLETKEQYKERVRADLLKAKNVLEGELHSHVFTFAYPYGRYSDELIDLLRETGHELMYTVEEGVIRKGMDITRLPRINVDGYYSAEKLIRVIKKYAAM